MAELNCKSDYLSLTKNARVAYIQRRQRNHHKRGYQTYNFRSTLCFNY